MSVRYVRIYGYRTVRKKKSWEYSRKLETVKRTEYRLVIPLLSLSI